MGYYDVYLKRQTEIMDESMELATRELAGVVQSEKAYREYLQSQLTAMDKQVAAYKKAARSSGGLTGEQNFKLFNAQRAVNNDLNAQVKGVKDFSLKVDKATRFNSTSLSSQNNDFMEAATKPDVDKAVREVVNLALTNEQIDKLKGGAAQSHELASQSYAIDLKGWMVDQLENAGQQLSPKHLKAIEDGVFQITGVNPALQTQQSLEAKRTRLQETTVGEIPITAYQSARELRKLRDTLVDLNDEQRSAIQLRIEQLEEEGGGRDAIEDRLEALGAPTEITAEAVRARAGEIAKPQLYDPYARQREAVGERRERRLADLVEGRETRSVWDKTPRMEDARIRRLERLTGANDLATQFDKLSEDQKIMMTQGVRALQNYRAGGSVLPEDQGSIEWQRANEMYSQLGAGTLVGGNNAIRVATELAQADLGSGAPASDVRRHRDEIMERFLMLTLNEKNATAASTPTQEAKEQLPEPEPEPAPVPAPVTTESADAMIEQRAPAGPLASEMGATQAEVDAMNPPYTPEYPAGPTDGGISASEQAIAESAQDLGPTFPGVAYTESPASMPTTPPATPERGLLPSTPRGTGLLTEIERMTPTGVTAKDALDLFVGSESPATLPFGEEMYELLATAAIASGMAPPRWYTTPPGSAPVPTSRPLGREPARRGPPPGSAPVRSVPPTRSGS